MGHPKGGSQCTGNNIALKNTWCILWHPSDVTRCTKYLAKRWPSRKARVSRDGWGYDHENFGFDFLSHFQRCHYKSRLWSAAGEFLYRPLTSSLFSSSDFFTSKAYTITQISGAVRICSIDLNSEIIEKFLKNSKTHTNNWKSSSTIQEVLLKSLFPFNEKILLICLRFFWTFRGTSCRSPDRFVANLFLGTIFTALNGTWPIKSFWSLLITWSVLPLLKFSKSYYSDLLSFWNKFYPIQRSLAYNMFWSLLMST